MQNLYAENEIMQVIGTHFFNKCLGDGAGIIDFNKVLKAHTHNDNGLKRSAVFDVAMDFFVLGFIYGKKIERSERNHTPITTLTDMLSAQKGGDNAEKSI